jgi:hypothetical protein
MDMTPSWQLNIACGPCKNNFHGRTIVNGPAPECSAVLRGVSGDAAD